MMKIFSRIYEIINYITLIITLIINLEFESVKYILKYEIILISIYQEIKKSIIFCRIIK